jgi:hypothetical protein
MKKIILLLSLTLVISCNQNEDYQDNLDLSNLDFSELNFGLNEKEIVINIDLNNQKLINEFSNELINEIDELIDGKKDIYYNFTLILNKKNKSLKIINISKNQIYYTLHAKSAGDPIEDLMGSCPDGWTDEGNCSSADCVKKKVGAVLTKVESNGDCQRVEVSRGFISAKVCSQSCAK